MDFMDDLFTKVKVKPKVTGAKRKRGHDAADKGTPLPDKIIKKIKLDTKAELVPDISESTLYPNKVKQGGFQALAEYADDKDKFY